MTKKATVGGVILDNKNEAAIMLQDFVGDPLGNKFRRDQ